MANTSKERGPNINETTNRALTELSHSQYIKKKRLIRQKALEGEKAGHRKGHLRGNTWGGRICKNSITTVKGHRVTSK